MCGYASNSSHYYCCDDDDDVFFCHAVKIKFISKTILYFLQ
jgi:hypothetical protein